jgi:hypothetical protein
MTEHALSRRAHAVIQRLGIEPAELLGMRFATNVAIGTVIVWNALRALGDPHPIWGIASMIAASDPQPGEARRMFHCRLANVAVGSASGLAFLIVGGPQDWILPLALAVTVLVSTYIVRVKTMWRQAPITAAVVIASAITSDSSFTGVVQGAHKVAEVVFGCVTGVAVSLLMSCVWLIRDEPAHP